MQQDLEAREPISSISMRGVEVANQQEWREI